MDFSKYNLEEIRVIMDYLSQSGTPLPSELEEWENILKSGKLYPILLARYQWGEMPQDKKVCIETTVNQLMIKGTDADDPVLLMGYLQGGKTDTYLHTIAKAMDEGIDIAIVLVSNNSGLRDQTLERTIKDFEPLKQVIIRKADELKNIRSTQVFKENKGVIVALKNIKNMEWLISLLLDSKSPLVGKRILIVDDEADVASRNYIEKLRETSEYFNEFYKSLKKGKRGLALYTNSFARQPLFNGFRESLTKVSEISYNDLEGCLSRLEQTLENNLREEFEIPQTLTQFKETSKDREKSKNSNADNDFKEALDLAKIAMKIDVLRYLAEDSRYLQVTATPYSLLLQPTGKIMLNGRTVKAFHPRFTVLAPTYPGYKGYEKFFVKAQDDASMCSHLFSSVRKHCMERLSKSTCSIGYKPKDLEDPNVREIVMAVLQYLISTAVRSIQEKNIPYSSAAVFHIAFQTETHGKLGKNINNIIEGLKDYVKAGKNSNPYLEDLFDTIYSDLKESNRKGKNSGEISIDIPSDEVVFSKLSEILINEDYAVTQVNKNNKEAFENGYLKFEKTCNIFIGGKLLDRGITIPHLLTFFYGRLSQGQDTTMQHIRLFGNRSNEDMAVTRWYATEINRARIERMFEIDESIREQIKAYGGDTQLNVTFHGEEEDFQPTAKNKLAASQMDVVKPLKRFLPVGMWIVNNEKTKEKIQKIDAYIRFIGASRDEKGFFECDFEIAKSILNQIQETYKYDSRWNNQTFEKDIYWMINVLEYCTNHSKGKVLMRYVTDREMNRLRQNGSFQDSPDGEKDRLLAKERAIDKPVVSIFKQKGNITLHNGKNVGWDGCSFFWPVLVVQKNITPAIFTIAQK